MVVRRETVEWVIKDGNLYKQTTLIDKAGGVKWAPSWASEYIRKATDQDKFGNV